MSAEMTKKGIHMRRHANAEEYLRQAFSVDRALHQKMAREFIAEFYPIGTPVGIHSRVGGFEVVGHPTEQMEKQDQLQVMCVGTGYESWVPLWKVRVLWKHIYD